MALQLRNRLDPVFSDEPWQHVNSHRPWLGGVGTRIPDVRTMVVHETSGWSPRAHGRQMFVREFVTAGHKGETSQLYVSGDGTVLMGMDLPLATNHGTFVNAWSLASETGHGWGNYRGNDHLGPYTATNETMIPHPTKPPPAMIMHGGLVDPPARKPGNLWVAASGDGTIDDAGDDDLPGIKLFIRYDGVSEIVVGWWTTARYGGPWRQPQRVPEMLFNEAQYRSWAILARWIAEEYLLPRNFPLLPHKMRSSGFGAAGGLHGMVTDGASYASIVLSDEVLSRATPAALGMPATTPLPLTRATLQTAYANAGRSDPNPMWTRVFNSYRGFHGHGFSGDPSGNDHDCPGPMFDWHRFAREVWDWWWWPFDFDTANPTTAVDRRPYSLRTWNGNTPLTEYYWSTATATPQGRVRTGLHGARSSPATFELPQNSRIYALANGELVAARLPAETDHVSLAFMLVRHEVYHQLDGRPPAAGTATTLPVFANRIDYNVAPTTVYSLYMHLGRPAGLSFERVVPENPDWLNRVLMREKECELGLAFRASSRSSAVTDAIWNNAPPGSVARPTVLAGWQADNEAYSSFLASLSAGDVAVPSRAADTMPIRILLGDCLASAGVISRDAATARRGVRIEIFSSALISNTDFALTDATATGGGWAPGAGVGAPAVRYASEWARTPAGAELTALQTAGVDTPALVNWWRSVQPATLHTGLPTDAALDANGLVVHYDPMTFLPWLNGRTWRSEWPKYRTTDASGGVPATPVAR